MRIAALSLASLLVVSFGESLSVHAQGAEHQSQPPSAPCVSSFATGPVNVADAFAGILPSVTSVWGQNNAKTLPKGAGTSGPIFRITYPKGSYDPGSKQAPLGGAGFFLRDSHNKITACLSYKVRFENDFKFAKGGKLPGLAGGDAPRGSMNATMASGFSARLMWRAGGKGELYLYAPGRDTPYGQSVGRGSWTFQPGAWTAVSEEVDLNDPGSANGNIRVWVNGQVVVDAQDLTLRTDASVGANGLIFSTFFGGNDSSWASPKTQYADFADFQISF